MSLNVTLFKQQVSIYLIDSINGLKGEPGTIFGRVDAVNYASIVVNVGDMVCFQKTEAILIYGGDWTYYIVDENKIKFKELSPP